MLPELLLLASLATAPVADPPAPASTSANVVDEVGTRLLESLVAVCARHPEVERAYFFSRQGPNGIEYMFVPIFDRKVSDAALADADRAYKEILPDGPGLGLMLLARNTWKKEMAGVDPVYIRPKK